ncbi:MAG: hypothetical protein GWM90_17825 [Gemmatimonadetes bacterium]|nr:hypothetical protein [Gemmatimonadota bacterium]NIQ56213.1 hypothetical protein [Gemmatimonadota bacterium]NIX45882.1 hypothetical protein [Gemmatimonadota bacterium]NIY10190.1 hypothetical protein [Gemmatimonadota bacterium]
MLVLNDKIQHGPEPVTLPAGTRREDLVEAASRRVREERFSMTESRGREAKPGGGDREGSEDDEPGEASSDEPRDREG